MRFAIHFMSVEDTLVAVGEGSTYATVVIPGTRGKKKRDEDEGEFAPWDDASEGVDESPESEAGKRPKKVVATRKQLEAMKPGQAATVKSKQAFRRLVGEGDMVAMLGGGIGAVYARALQVQGASVLTVPTFKAKEHRLPDEQPHLFIAELHRNRPDLFRQIPEEDEARTRLRILHRARLAVQGGYRKPVQQSMSRVIEDIELLAPSQSREAKLRRDWASGMLLRRVLRRGEQDSARLREVEDSLQAILAEAKEGTGDKRLGDALETVRACERSVVDEMARMRANPLYYHAKLTEADLRTELDRTLKGIPVYDAVFGQIPGMGPLVAGAIIAEIYDISSFRSPYALANYAGWGFDPGTNRRQQRTRGKVSGWNPNLKQGLYQWAEWVVKSGRNVLVRKDAPLALGDRVELSGSTYRKVDEGKGFPVTWLKQQDIGEALEEARDAITDLDADDLGRADLAALIEELEQRADAGEESVAIASVAMNRWREYYDLKRRTLLEKHPEPIRVKEGNRYRLKFTPMWIHRTGIAKMITQVIDVIWTLWTQREAPEVYHAWHDPREERYRKWRESQRPASVEPNSAPATTAPVG